MANGSPPTSGGTLACRAKEGIFLEKDGFDWSKGGDTTQIWDFQINNFKNFLNFSKVTKQRGEQERVKQMPPASLNRLSLVDIEDIGGVWVNPRSIYSRFP